MTDSDANILCYEDHHENGTYDGVAGTTDPQPVRQFFTQVGIEGKDIIDVGCGTSSCPGSSVVELAEAAKGKWDSYIGVDHSPKLVNEFNRKHVNRNAKAEIGDALKLKFDDNSKDIVVCLFLSNWP